MDIQHQNEYPILVRHLHDRWVRRLTGIISGPATGVSGGKGGVAALGGAVWSAARRRAPLGLVCPAGRASYLQAYRTASLEATQPAIPGSTAGESGSEDPSSGSSGTTPDSTSGSTGSPSGSSSNTGTSNPGTASGSGSSSSGSISPGKISRTIPSSSGAPMPVMQGSYLPGAQRSTLFSSASPGDYGHGPPNAGGLYPIYGFWPLGWETDVPTGQANNNSTRPGGALLSAGLQSQAQGTNNSVSATYVIYGDTTSVQDLLPQLLADCGAVKSTAPGDLSTNRTVQDYRDDSFALYRFPKSANATYDAAFEACLNNTIGTNILVIDNVTVAAAASVSSDTSGSGSVDGGAPGPLVLLLVLFASGAASLWR